MPQEAAHYIHISPLPQVNGAAEAWSWLTQVRQLGDVSLEWKAQSKKAAGDRCYCNPDARGLLKSHD